MKEMTEMKPDYSTPKAAVRSALAAYRSFDSDLVMQTRDFAIDSRLFWEDLGIPVEDDQMVETAKALQTSFKRMIEEDGVTDYNGVSTEIIQTEIPKDGFAVVSLRCVPDGGEEMTLRLGLIRTQSGWKLARVPGLDQL